MADTIPTFVLYLYSRRGFMVDKGAKVMPASTRKRRRGNPSYHRHHRVRFFMVNFPVHRERASSSGMVLSTNCFMLVVRFRFCRFPCYPHTHASGRDFILISKDIRMKWFWR